MIVGATSMYLGAAVAVGLFDVLSPSAVAWFADRRRRPGLGGVGPPRTRRLAVEPAATGDGIRADHRGYEHHLLRSVVAPAARHDGGVGVPRPIAVAVVGSRTRRDMVALVFAIVGSC